MIYGVAGVAGDGKGTWVAVGVGTNTILYSTDNGSTWTPATGITFSSNGSSVSYGDRWVAVGFSANEQTILTSNDGKVWTKDVGTAFTYGGSSVAYVGNKKWTAVGSGLHTILQFSP